MNLREKYTKEVSPALKQELGLKNVLEVPKITKVVVNVGLGNSGKDDAYFDTVEKTLVTITGQKPVRTVAKKSIAGFKIREGMVVGMKVTLRGNRMYSFVDKLINITLPRIRDFRGLRLKSVDRQGNLSIGFSENLAFPEINPDAVDTMHGLEVVISTSAKTKEDGIKLLTLLGFPFRKDI